MKTHIVRSGETLEKIASAYGLSAGDLAVYNRIANNNSIKEGQELKLELPKDARPIHVSIGAGDSLDTVAKQFNTSVERIMALNNLATRNVEPGARLVAWDPFRLNYVSISKPQDIDTLAKKIGTSSDVLKAVNPQIDFNKVSGETKISVPWQLQKWQESIKAEKIPVDDNSLAEAKTSSLPQPLDLPKVKEEKQKVEIEFPDYKEHHIFTTPLPKYDRFVDNVPLLRQVTRGSQHDKYIKDITDEYEKASKVIWDGYIKARDSGNREAQFKLLSYAQNTNKEFERVTGIRVGMSEKEFEQAVWNLKYPDDAKKIKEAKEGDALSKSILNNLEIQLKQVEGAGDRGVTDRDSALRFTQEADANIQKIQKEGVEKKFIEVDKDGKIKYRDDGLPKFTKEYETIFEDYFKDKDALEMLYTSLGSAQELWSNFPDELEDCLLTTDINQRQQKQRAFLNKYADLKIVNEMQPKFMNYNNLYLEVGNMEKIVTSKLEKLSQINNADVIISALASGNIDSYQAQFKELGITSKDVANAGNLIREVGEYQQKAIALSQQIDNTSNEFVNAINIIQKNIFDYDNRVDLQNFFIKGANPTSELGKALKGIVLSKATINQLRATNLGDAENLVKLSDLFSWLEKYIKATQDAYVSQEVSAILDDSSEKLFEASEARKQLAAFSWWGDKRYADVKGWEKAMGVFGGTLGQMIGVDLEKDPNWLQRRGRDLIKAIDFWFNDVVNKKILPGYKTANTYAQMIYFQVPEAAKINMQYSLGFITKKERDILLASWDTGVKAFANLAFGVRDFRWRNVSSVYSQLSSMNIEEEKIPILGEDGKQLLDEQGNPIYRTSYNQKIMLIRDWDIVQILKDGNRLDLLSEVKRLNPGIDISNVKAGQTVTVPRFDIGMSGAMIRGADGYLSPQDFWEKSLTSPEFVETVNQVFEIFGDPLTYVTIGAAQGLKMLTAPARYLVGTTTAGTASATLRKGLAKSATMLLTGGEKMGFLAKKTPALAKFYAGVNKRIEDVAAKLFPDVATSPLHVVAKMDAWKNARMVKTSDIVLKSTPTFIDFWLKPRYLSDLKVPKRVTESVLNFRDNFSINYIKKNLDSSALADAASRDISVGRYVVINKKNGKQVIGRVTGAPSRGTTQDVVRVGGVKKVIGGGKGSSVTVQIDGGKKIPIFQKDIKNIKIVPEKSVIAMDKAWRKTNPFHSYVIKMIAETPNIRSKEIVFKDSGWSDFKKGNYVTVRRGDNVYTGKIAKIDNKEITLLNPDGKLLTYKKDGLSSGFVYDSREIESFRKQWNDSLPTILESIGLGKMERGVKAVGNKLSEMGDAFFYNQLISRLPPEMRVFAADIINRAGFYIQEKSALQTKGLFEYFARAWNDVIEEPGKVSPLGVRARKADGKVVDLRFNQRLAEDGMTVVEVTGLSMDDVINYKIRQLVLSPELATIDDWRVLCKYGVYPTAIYEQIGKLSRAIARGDTLSNLLIKDADFLTDLVKSIDRNAFDPVSEATKARMNIEVKKYLFDDGVLDKEVDNILAISEEYSARIANTSDEIIISKAKKEIIELYGEENFKRAENVFNIYKSYVDDLLMEERSLTDAFYIEVSENISIEKETKEVTLPKFNKEEVSLTTIVIKEKGKKNPLATFEPGTEKAEVIELLTALNNKQRLKLYAKQKILRNIEVQDVIETIYNEGIMSRPELKRIHDLFLKEKKLANLSDFIDFVEAYRGLLTVDKTSFDRILSIISRRANKSTMDELRMSIMTLIKKDGASFLKGKELVDDILRGRVATPAGRWKVAKLFSESLENKKILLKNRRYIVLDFESTGTNIKTDRIIQLGYKIIDGEGNVIKIGGEKRGGSYLRGFDDSFTEELFNKQGKEAQVVHKISADKIKEEGIPLKDMIENLVQEFDNVDGVIAHNADFDLGLLKVEMGRVGGMDFDTIMKRKPVFDTMAHIDSKFKGKSLDDMHMTYIGESLEGAHDALKDVEGLIRIYKKAQQEGKVSKILETDNTATIYRALTELKEQLETIEKVERVPLALAVGEKANWMGTTTKSPEELAIIRRVVSEDLVGESWDSFINATQEELTITVESMMAKKLRIFEDQKRFKPRKGARYEDGSIRDVMFKNKDKIEELQIKKRELEESLLEDLIESKKNKITKDIENISNGINKLRVEDLKPINHKHKIKVLNQEFGGTPSEIEQLKQWSNDGYRFLVYTTDYNRLRGAERPAIKALRDIGLVEELSMAKAVQRGQAFDFWVYNEKSWQLKPGRLKHSLEEQGFFKDKFRSTDFLSRIIFESQGNEKDIISSLLRMQLNLRKGKGISKKDFLTHAEDVDYIAKSFANTFIKYLTKNKDMLKLSSHDEIIEQLRFIETMVDIRKISTDKGLDSLKFYLDKALDVLDVENVTVYNLENLSNSAKEALVILNKIQEAASDASDIPKFIRVLNEKHYEFFYKKIKIKDSYFEDFLNLEGWLNLPENKHHIKRIDESKSKMVDKEALDAYESYKKTSFLLEEENFVEPLDDPFELPETPASFEVAQRRELMAVLEEAEPILSSSPIEHSFLARTIESFGSDRQGSMAAMDELVKRYGVKIVTERNSVGLETKVLQVDIYKMYEDNILMLGGKENAVTKASSKLQEQRRIEFLPAGIYSQRIAYLKKNKFNEVLVAYDKIYDNNVHNKIIFSLGEPNEDMLKHGKYKEGDIIITDAGQEINTRIYNDVKNDTTVNIGDKASEYNARRKEYFQEHGLKNKISRYSDEELFTERYYNDLKERAKAKNISVKALVKEEFKIESPNLKFVEELEIKLQQDPDNDDILKSVIEKEKKRQKLLKDFNDKYFGIEADMTHESFKNFVIDNRIPDDVVDVINLSGFKEYNIYKVKKDSQYEFIGKNVSEEKITKTIKEVAIDEDKAYLLQDNTIWRSSKKSPEDLSQMTLWDDVSVEFESMPDYWKNSTEEGGMISVKKDDLREYFPERTSIKPKDLFFEEMVLENAEVYAVKNLDSGKVNLAKGNDGVDFENILTNDRVTGEFKIFRTPKKLSALDETVGIEDIRRALVRERDNQLRVDYIIIDAPDAKYIEYLKNRIAKTTSNKLKKELGEELIVAESNFKNFKRIEKAIREDRAAENNLKNFKIYRINSAEDVVTSFDLSEVSALRNDYFSKKSGFVLSNNHKKTSNFFNGRVLTPRERHVVETVNNVYGTIRNVVNTPKQQGTDFLFSKQSRLFVDVMTMEDSVVSLQNRIEKMLATDRITEHVLDMVSTDKRPWHGKEILVIGLENAQHVSREFYTVVNDLTNKNCTFVFSENLNAIEQEMYRYVKSRNLKVKQLNLDNRRVLVKAKTEKEITAMTDIERIQYEEMRKASYTISVGKIDDAEKLTKRMLAALDARDANLLVYSDSKIIQEQMNALNTFFKETYKDSFKMPSAAIRKSLFEGNISLEEAVQSVISTSVRKSIHMEWYEWKEVQIENYRETLKEKYKELGLIESFGKRDLAQTTAMIEEQVAALRKTFDAIDKHVIKWKGSGGKLDKILVDIRKSILNDLVDDIARGKKGWEEYEKYMKTGKVSASLKRILSLHGVNTWKTFLSIPSHLQSVFIMFVLRLSPRWYINNALDDTLKTLMLEKDFKRFLQVGWLNTRIYAHFGKVLAQHTGIDIAKQFFRLQKRLGLIDADQFNLKIKNLKAKKDFDLVSYLKDELGENDLARFVDRKGGVSVVRKDGSIINYTPEELDYMISPGIQEFHTSAAEARAAFNLINPKNPFESVKYKFKEYEMNLDLFAAQSERFRRSFALQRILQDQTVDIVRAKALIKDYFFDYRDVNRASMFMRKFFPFFTFNYYTVRLYLKLLLGKYGYQTYRAGEAIMSVWEKNTQHLPEYYKDRISINIGGREFLLRPNISIIDVMRFIHDPYGVLKDMAENPNKLILGLGWSPVMGRIANELGGIDYYTPSAKDLREQGWNYFEIEKRLKEYDEAEATKDAFDSLYETIYAIIPQVDIINSIFFKQDVNYEKSGNIFKSKSFREITKMFALNIMEWDAVDKLQQKLYSLPPSVREYYRKKMKEEDPETFKEWERQSLVAYEGNLRNKRKSGIIPAYSEDEIFQLMNERVTQNTFYEKENEKKGSGNDWLNENPERKAVMEKIWKEGKMDSRKEYTQAQIEATSDTRAVKDILESIIPSNLTESNLEKYKALGYDFPSAIDRDSLIRDLTNKGLTLNQMNILISEAYADEGVELIRSELFEKKKLEQEEYKNLSQEQKDELDGINDAYDRKLRIINKLLPASGASEEDTQEAFKRWKDALNTYLTPQELKRYQESMPDAQRILRKAQEEYIKTWGDIIDKIENNTLDEGYYQTFNKQPSWFKEFYYLSNPNARKYYPVATEREIKLSQIREAELKGVNVDSARKDLDRWLWAQNEALEAWEEEKPDIVRNMRMRSDYDNNFRPQLQSFANVNNWYGYYSLLLDPKNSKYLEVWKESGSFGMPEEEKTSFINEKLNAAKLSKKYYSLPATTWVEQKARGEWLDKNPELRTWWDRNKNKEDVAISKKVSEYHAMKFDIPNEGSGYSYYAKWKEISVLREQLLKDNPAVAEVIKSGNAELSMDPNSMKAKVQTYNSLSQERKKEYLNKNPDLAKYFLNSMPDGIRKVRELQDEYFKIEEKDYSTRDAFYDAKNSFVQRHPELKDYWDAMALPSSAFVDKPLFNQYQNYVSKILKYYDSVSSEGLEDSLRVGLSAMTQYMSPGESEEDTWLKSKIYGEAMKTWVRLLGENKSIGMFFFRQLPNWIRAKYYDNNPEKLAMANYSLGNWFAYPVWQDNQNNPEVTWATRQQKKYGKNMPLGIKKRVEKILRGAGQWEDRRAWTGAQWDQWQNARAARLNGLKQKDINTNPLIRKELYRAAQFFSSVAPVRPGIYKKKIKWILVPDESLTRL